MLLIDNITTLQGTSVLCIGLLATTNIILLRRLTTEIPVTLINKLILLDCTVALLNIPIIFNIGQIYKFPCAFIGLYAYFVTCVNRLLPVGIVLFRYVYVCKSGWIESATNRKTFHSLIILILGTLTFSLTLSAYLYQSQSTQFLKCVDPTYESEDIFGVWTLPIYHPFHFLSVLTFNSSIILVPVGYCLIYKFRKTQDATVRGLSELDRKTRMRKNLVTCKFNIIIWFTELICGCLIFIPGSQYIKLFYLVAPNIISPIIYYIGMESNRKELKKYFLELFKESKDIAVKAAKNDK